MHDCPKIQEKLFDLVLHELATGEQAEVLAEVATCARCQAELGALEKTLTLYDQAIAFNELTAAEWQTYESKLQKRVLPRKSISQSLWRQIFFGSVRIPAPIFAAALLFVCAAAFFAFRPVKSEVPAIVSAGDRQPLMPPMAGIVPTPTPETIVVREERIVTRKIYVAKRQSSPRPPKLPPAKNLVETNENPLNLAEFKPVRPIEPSVVKGSKPK